MPHNVDQPTDSGLNQSDARSQSSGLDPSAERSTRPRAWVDRFGRLIRGESRGFLASLFRAVLWWVRLPYGVAVGIRNWRYDRAARSGVSGSRIFRPGVPVISVGNLTLGGTGKTPCVEYIAGLLRDRGVCVAILSRGYGVEHGPNDEALLLEDNLPDVPHLQGAARSALAAVAVEELECEAIVLDDGFQHRRLYRDLDIVLVDATRPLASEYLFPRGVLREPVASLRRAGFAILTRCDQVSETERESQRTWFAQHFPKLPLAMAIHSPVELISSDDATAEPESLRGTDVAAFCGIANPTAFRKTLEDLGAKVLELRTYPDHHAYARQDVDALRQWAETFPTSTLILTTQKDWVKLRLGELAGRRLWAVRVGLTFLEGEDELHAAVVGVLREIVPTDDDDFPTDTHDADEGQ